MGRTSPGEMREEEPTGYSGLRLPSPRGWLGPVISQAHLRNSPSHHAGAHGVLDWLMERGAYARLLVGSRPLADRDHDGNRERLVQGLGGRLHCVDIWGGTEDEDGSITLSGFIRFDAFDGSASFVIAVDEAPLEIGVTKARTTLRHLEHQWQLARWPYGSEWLTVLALRPDKQSAIGDVLAQRRR